MLLASSVGYSAPSNPPKEALQSARDMGVPVKEYVFESERVFLVDARQNCCDQGALVYGENGTLICQYGGWDGWSLLHCESFDKNAKYIKTVFSPEPASTNSEPGKYQPNNSFKADNPPLRGGLRP
jgi:hypothetical protein